MADLDSTSTALTNSARIEQALEGLQEFGAQAKYQEFWDATIDVEELFMSLRPTLEGSFERLWMRYCKIRDSTQQQETALRQQEKVNDARIEREIERLTRIYLGRRAQAVSPGLRYRHEVFWANAEALQKQLRSLPLAGEDRERLEAGYTSLCDQVRHDQEQEREESTVGRQNIVSMVGDVLPLVEHSPSSEELSTAREMLRKALQEMKQSPLLEEDREYCWTCWREANDKVSSKLQQLQTAAHDEATKQVDQCVDNAAQGDPYAALSEIKEVQLRLNELYLARDQRAELGRRLNDAWQQAQTRIGQLREERQRRRQEWLQREEQRKLRQQQWQEGMLSKLEEWESYVNDGQEEASRLEQEMQGLREEVQHATRPEYARVLRSMVAQKQKEIDRQKQQTAQWQSRIQELRSQLPDPSPSTPSPSPQSSPARAEEAVPSPSMEEGQSLS